MIVERLSKTAIKVDGKILFEHKGVYGTISQRADREIVSAVCDFLVLEQCSEEGTYYRQMNEVLREAKIRGSLKLCLELL